MMVLTILLAAVFTRSMERVSTMDPVYAQSIYDSRAIQLVYEPPLAIDYQARPYRLVPAYCELPKVSEDGLMYVFRTRHGPAKDMVRMLNRLADPAEASPNAWIVKDVASVRAVDERTVSIKLNRPVRYFSWLMAMSSAAVVGENGEGTGPYRLAEWRKNHSMTFDRRVTVGNGGFDRVKYLVVDDMSTQWLMFLRGELDFIGEISRDNFDSVVGADGRLTSEIAARGVRLYSQPTLEVLYLGVNMRDRLLGGNRKLRQALNAAFDFPRWRQFYNNRVMEANGPVPPGVAERDERSFAYRFDLEKAKSLMAAAGYAGGIDPATGRRLVLTLAIGRATQESREAGELLASFYERIGIKLELDFMTWDAFLKAVNEGRVQLYRMGWVGDYPDAQNFLQLFYGPNRSPGVNHCNFADAAYDAAYERGDYARCQEIVREECPWVFTHYNMGFSLVGPRVENYVPSDFPAGGEQYYRPNL